MEGSVLRIGVLTCSGERAAGAEDSAGLALIDACEEKGWLVVAYYVTPEDSESVAASLIDMCDVEQADVVFTIGKTGLEPSDIVPEVTSGLCERMVPGVAELIRQRSAMIDQISALSRAVSGLRGGTLIINLPGGPKATADAFDYVANLLAAAVEQLRSSDEAHTSRMAVE